MWEYLFSVQVIADSTGN